MGNIILGSFETLACVEFYPDEERWKIGNPSDIKNSNYKVIEFKRSVCVLWDLRMERVCVSFSLFNHFCLFVCTYLKG